MRIAGIFALPLLALTLVSAGRAAERLGHAVVPVSEAVDLRLDADQPGYSGSVKIELDVREPAGSFAFHAEDMQLAKLSLQGSGGAVATTHKTGGEHGLVTVRSEKPLAPGRYTLAIEFSNDFGTKAVGLYRMTQDGHGYAFTQFEPDDAREAFPCWDEPEFKIPWQLTISVPEKHLAVTNTPVEKESASGGWKTFTFARTRPLPSYLIAVATGPLETVPIQGMSVPGRIVVPLGQTALASEAAKLAPPILAALERYFGRPYPYEKLDLIAVPEFWPGAMENAGAITFADRVLLLDPATMSQERRGRTLYVIAHEMAHMWFGDLVTMAWWDDLWLNESFADWMASKISQEVAPEYHYDVKEMGGIQDLMHTDARPSTPAIRKPVMGTENLLQEVGIAYDKGKAVLGMFESFVGEERFRKGVQDYLHAHEWGSATAQDLWSAVSKAAGSDVSGPMASFLDQNGVPLVSVELLPDGGVKLTQERFLNAGVKTEARTWQIPVGLELYDGTGVNTETVLLDAPEKTLPPKKSGSLRWVYPNADERGYYRWKVSAAMLADLAHDASKRLDVRERYGFVGNLSALLDAGALHGDELLRSLQPFGQDPDPLVLDAVFDAMDRVKQAFVTDELQEPFARYVRQTFAPTLERIGLKPVAGEPLMVSLLRPRLMSWLGVSGRDETVLRYAEELAKAYRADPASVDPALAEEAIQLAARRGDRVLFDEFRKRFETAQIPAQRRLFLSALGCFRDPALQDEALRYSLAGPLRPNELHIVSECMDDTEQDRDKTFRWTLQNHDSIVKRLPPMFASFIPFTASGCSAERLKQAQEFFGQPAHQVPGTADTMDKVADQVNDCVRLREREGKAVEKLLRDQAGAN
jgi:peptidase M1-like protein/ERAP1-like protein